MPIHEINADRFDEVIGRTAAERDYAAVVCETVPTAFYETDDDVAVGVVICDPGGDAISYGWEVYRGHECIARGSELEDEDAALVACVRAMVGRV